MHLELDHVTLEFSDLAASHISLDAMNSPPPPANASFEFPGAPVPLDSPFYIERPPIEKLAFAEIQRPGSVVRIKAPRKMGKSSLLLQILHHARQLDYQIVNFDFQQADAQLFCDLDYFLRWFCYSTSLQLHLEPKLDDYWDEYMGSKVNCTTYFQDYLLPHLTQPLVLTLNELNRVFEHEAVAQDFLPLLRYWHEKSKSLPIFRHLRLVVVHSTEIYIPLNLNQSPFNIGLPLHLPEFTLEQIQDLALRHGLDWQDRSLARQLMAMVGGHPYLVRMALYHLCQSDMSLAKFLSEAPTQGGIYSHYLRDHLVTLKQNPDLAAAVQQVFTAPRQGATLSPTLTYKLTSIGLVRQEGDRVRPSCDLYRLYFEAQQLTHRPLSPVRLEQLEQENIRLQNLLHIDEITAIGNRRCFDQMLQNEWLRLARAVAPLAIILCSIDEFQRYRETYGQSNSEKCLKWVAQAIKSSLRRPADLVTYYGAEVFAILLPYNDANGANHLANNLRTNIKALAIQHQDKQSPLPCITISLGIAATIPVTHGNPGLLLKGADQALHHAKQKGGDCLHLSTTVAYCNPNETPITPILPPEKQP